MATYRLDTGKKYIKEIYASDCFYNIPEYQRPYVWGEEQINALLEDITSTMEQSKDKEYFLGCMIWNTKKIKSNEVEYTCQDILDGQQRFISIYILQGVIRDLSENSDLKSKVRERMKQKADPFEGTPERNRIEFEIRNDKAFLELCVIEDNGTTDEVTINKIIKDKDTGTSSRNMALAVLYMRSWWRNKFSSLKSNEERQKYINNFYSFLSTKVLALYLATPDNLDDAYNLFTVLNSRGIQLRVSDILRAQNLREINDDRQRREYAKLWEKYENGIASPYKSFDDFLWSIVYIKMKYSSDDNQSLNKAFNFMYDKNYLKKGKETFDLVGRYVEHFKSVTQESLQENEYGLFFLNLNYILTSTFGNSYIAPLMHYKECFGEYRIADFILKLDNLLSVIWLTSSRNSQFRIFTMLRKMDDAKKEVQNQYQAADSFLKEPIFDYGYQDAKAFTAVDINLFYNMLDVEKWGSFNGTRSNKTRYVLLKLDLIVSSPYTQLSYNKSFSSIEHLMPQKIDPKYWSVDENEYKEWLHRLGNIVLIDRKKNSSLSNSSYDTKKTRYQSAIESRANTNNIFIQYKSWDIDTIKKNHQRSLQLLKEYYEGNSLQTLILIRKKLSNNIKY
ncbi:DUF262 domain-containing protein [Larkinella terrae]|uniref:DUF262 domain-containing protein n=1 Tax=Larkinella terrae TaxID=2025311 RepID=A0A7K0ENE6_9BACT|nr:DUF262 domain-containing protein [Larkinella terrae]MRS63363.1 DUF262 domain-containing protein [Larkinella terrae]